MMVQMRRTIWQRSVGYVSSQHRLVNDHAGPVVSSIETLRTTADRPSAVRCPLASKDSRNITRFFGAETGTVFGTVSLGDLEP